MVCFCYCALGMFLHFFTAILGGKLKEEGSLKNGKLTNSPEGFQKCEKWVWYDFGF